MSNALQEISRWLKFDLELEHMLQIQDLRLVQLGFSHAETMNMTLQERSHYLEIGTNIKRIDQYQDAMLAVETGTLANGFSDKKTRKKLYSEWDKTLKNATKGLEFTPVANVATGSSKGKLKSNKVLQGSASKYSPVKKEGTVSLKDKIGKFAKLKNIGD